MMKSPLTDSSNSQTDVVFRLSAMGDVALLTGVLHYWHEQFQLKFVVITRAEWTSLFDNHPAVIAVEALSKKDLKQSNYRKKCRELAERYADSPLLDMHVSMRSRLLSLYWKAPAYHYNKRPFMRRLFLLSKGKFGKNALLEKNVCQRYASLICPKIPERNLLKPRIFLSDEEKKEAGTSLARLFQAETFQTDSFSGNKKIIAIHPFATHRAKSFSLERWQEIGEAILKNFGNEYRLLWLGKGNLPANFCERENSRSLVNKTDLRELCAMLGRTSLLITGDSGPMHLANAVNTPLLALFGPTTEEWGFFPVGDNVHVIQKAMPCRPCSLHGKGSCRQKENCLDKITTEEILQCIRDILAEKAL